MAAQGPDESKLEQLDEDIAESKKDLAEMTGEDEARFIDAGDDRLDELGAGTNSNAPPG